MGFPSLAQRLEPAPTVVWRELDRKDIAQLSIEISAFGLRPLDHADNDVPQCRQSPGDNPQRHRFAGARFTGHEREASLLDELLDTPGEMVDPGCHQQSIAGQLG